MGSTTQLQSAIIMDSGEETIGPYVYYTSKQIGSGYSSKVYYGRKKNST